MGELRQGSRRETWKECPGTGGVSVSWEAQAPRVFEAGRLVFTFLCLTLAGSMLISPRFAFCALSVCSPLLLAGVAGAQVFGPPIPIGQGSFGAEDVEAADLDGDGDLDLVAAYATAGRVLWFENLGGGVFGGVEEITDMAANVRDVEVADLDGDGDLDVISASIADNKVAWYANLGNGEFGPQQIISTESIGPRSICVTDLDSDLDLDVVSASVYDNTVAWYRNSGNGVFGAREVVSSSVPFVHCVISVDLSGNGRPDLVSASWWDDEILWHENLGGGFFDSPQVISSDVVGPVTLASADLDGDGRLDVLSGSSYDNKVAWYQNMAAGVFGSQQVISTTADHVLSVSTGDANGDGKPDIFSASWGNNTLAWHENLGLGVFGSARVISVAALGPTAIRGADLDGDGLLDIVSSSELDGWVAWCRQDGDCNGNGIPDSIDIANGEPDCDFNGVPDTCQLAAGTASDCNSNAVLDSCDIAAGTVLDCNANGLIDSCELALDPALDLDLNGILDSCEVGGPFWFRSPITQKFMCVVPPGTWSSAGVQGTGFGGFLATIRSAEENDWLQAILPGDHFWIGYHDAAVEGTFMWHSLETPVYENWAPGAPGNFTADQDFVALRPSDGTWDTWFANSLYRAVVELDGDDCDGDLVPDGFQIQNDPALDMNGDGVLDSCIPPTYCTGAPNSSGNGGSIMALGSPELALNNLTLHASGLPHQQWSYFLMSQSQTSVPNFGGSQGVLCLGAPIVRFNMPGTGQVDQTTLSGERIYTLNFLNLPQAIVFQPGETWNFQLWFRDVNPGVTSNTTNGVTVMFR